MASSLWHQTRCRPSASTSTPASYANVRRILQEGRLPPEDAVRIEELINYFSYDYPAPAERTVPFSVNAEMAPTPWNADTPLVRIGLKGLRIARQATCRRATWCS